ncbi:nucleotidyltransferase domain-containing protein [Candidatus Pacearchaeota archaeon]|nr:nucleotidyltransferase domain-containing protein [Candidatus Pacearchaeota archaeon]
MNNKDKVLQIIFKNPTTNFHIRELARLIKLNPNTIINIIKKLSKENLLKLEKKKHITEISANIENKKFVEKKRISNLNQLYNSGLIEFLIKEFNPELISVIGSYSKGEDIEKSDIDIVIITEKEKSLNVAKFEKIMSRKIHLIITNYKKMSEEFYTNLINGIIVHGYLNKK